MPMGVLATLSPHARPYAQSPINLNGNVLGTCVRGGGVNFLNVFVVNFHARSSNYKHFSGYFWGEGNLVWKFLWHIFSPSGHYVCLASTYLSHQGNACLLGQIFPLPQLNSQQQMRRLALEVISQSETKSAQARKPRSSSCQLFSCFFTLSWN